MNNQIEINPMAILAAVLFNLGKTETVKVKPDDSPIEMQTVRQVVGIESQDDSLVCKLAMDKIMYYMVENPTEIKVKIHEGYLTLMFEKATPAARILNTNGQVIGGESEVLKQLEERLR